MDHYLEISLRPDPEFAPALLMNALFNKLHRALVQLGSEQIGVSFPDAMVERPHLGSRLRLHGSSGHLQALMALPWLSGMLDHANVSAILPVPENARHRTVRRVQVQSSPERLRRRYSRRHGVSANEALERLPDSIAGRLKLPFVTVRSQSTGQQFRLFIAHGPEQDTPQSGVFNCYGLSQHATLPWF